MLPAAVCGQDGITYPSKCDMECFGVKLAHKGECEKEGDASSTPEDGGCACYTLYDPVCGVNNKTYGNGG
jgi:coxsackievirus/adenovirus receptor